jgi:hypothetical protein
MVICCGLRYIYLIQRVFTRVWLTILRTPGSPLPHLFKALARILARVGDTAGVPWHGCTYWEAVKDVIHYLKGTAELKLMLGGTSAGLQAYVDADWASQPHRHSMSGYTILMHGSPVAWSACKQSIIALSTAEAEYIALTAITWEVLYLEALITELYEHIISPIPIYCDNQGAIALASKGKFHAHTKHINLQFHFILSLVKNSIIDIQYCPTEENIADIFTKALPRPQLQKLRAGLSLDTAWGGSVGFSARHPIQWRCALMCYVCTCCVPMQRKPVLGLIKLYIT